MYAQCPECLTFFRIRPEHLKAAGGNVRCSQCKHVFNALDSLRDDVSAEEIEAVEAARAQREAAKRQPEKDPRAAGDLFEKLDYVRNEELPLERLDDLPEPSAETGGASPFEEYDSVTDDAGATAAPGHRPGAAGGAFHRLDDPARSRPPRHWTATMGLALANTLLLLALAAQLVHWQRHQLLADATVAPYLQQVYRHAGMPLEPPRNLAMIRLSRSEVTSHDEYPTALRLTAVVENHAPHPQPWPHIRIDLEDRWGEPVGARYFEPGEYLRTPEKATTAMPTGERFAVELALQDPGATAVGFQARTCFRVNDKFACNGSM